jgi:hypothetical protein
MGARPDWYDMLLEAVDRCLGGAHRADPLFYSELLRVRRRIYEQACAASNDGKVTPARSRGGASPPRLRDAQRARPRAGGAAVRPPVP